MASGSTAHLEQRGVAQMNALTAAKLGLGTVTHFYGHFEPLLRDYRVQPWPDQMNYNDEQFRFGQVGAPLEPDPSARQRRVEGLPPGAPQAEHDLRSDDDGVCRHPRRHAHAQRRLARRPTRLPSLMDFFTPNRVNHGAYYFDWTSQDEVAWRNFYQVWFRLVNDYKKMGGRVTVSDDAAYTYNTWGFGYIHEMELLHEAGFHPLEVIRAATMHGAEALHEPKSQPLQFGIVRAGMLADMVIGRPEPAPEPQGALWHRPLPTERPDRPHRAGRRRSLHDQGRHRLRRKASAGRCGGDGGEAESGTGAVA